MWEETSGQYVKLFCFLYLLLFSCLCYGQEKPITLTPQAWAELMSSIESSEMEIQRLQTLLNETKIDLGLAKIDLTRALYLQATSLENYNEQKTFYLKLDEEQRARILKYEKTVHTQDIIIKVGGVTIGVLGITAFVVSLFQ